MGHDSRIQGYACFTEHRMHCARSTTCTRVHSGETVGELVSFYTDGLSPPHNMYNQYKSHKGKKRRRSSSLDSGRNNQSSVSQTIAKSPSSNRIAELRPIYGTQNFEATGISNMGQSCYINSVLQVLSNNPKFAEQILKVESQSIGNQYQLNQ